MSIDAKTTRVRTTRASFPNRVVAWLLRSPFHGLISGRTMLITVWGRKSGTIYTTPVNYVHEGDSILVISKSDRTWWKNLRGGGGATVTVLLKGKELYGSAEVVEDDLQAIARGYQAIRRGIYNKDVPDERAREKSRDRVLIRIVGVSPRSRS